MEAPQDSGRRNVLTWGLWAVLGIIAGASALPLAELVLRRTAGKRLKFVPVLDLYDMPEVGVKKLELSLAGGPAPDTRIFLKKDTAGVLTAISATCTHLGCLINYNRLKGRFICPCHGGVYDGEGNVISGPPPRALDRLPVKVESGRILVGFML